MAAIVSQIGGIGRWHLFMSPDELLLMFPKLSLQFAFLLHGARSPRTGRHNSLRNRSPEAMDFDTSDNTAKLAALYERAWNDKDFSARLDSDATSALEEVFGTLPEGVTFKVVRDTADTKHLHIPAAPAQAEVSDLDLLGAQGGTTPGCISAISLVTVISSAISIPLTKDT
ncbi:MAG: hypothetical protein AB3N15_16865 [Paracoccaceae bacterium]